MHLKDNKQQLIALAVAALLLVIIVVVLIAYSARADRPTPTPPDHPDTPTDPDEPQNPTDPTDPEPPYRYSADIEAYLAAIGQSYEGLLVNKNVPLGENYIPDNLVTLDTSDTLYGKSVQLEATAAAALKAMLLCMRADGIRDTYVTSGYRSYRYQLQLQNRYIGEEMAKNSSLTREQALAIVLTYSAEAGKSEHQSGLCIDFMTLAMQELDESFEDTAAFRWLAENACQFGFILRYPKGEEGITGYKYEPWHYRFVGRDAAVAIQRGGLTLEQYLDAKK